MEIQKEELWKDISDFKGWYQVSNLGRVRSIDRFVNYKKEGKAIRKGKILSSKVSNKGYLEVRLNVNGKSYYRRVHQLVATAFIPNPNKLGLINHINEIKTDNRVENLEWCTDTQNKEAYVSRRITIYQYSLKGKLLKIWHSLTKAANSINGDKSGIWHCCRGTLASGKAKKTYLGYIWSNKSLSETELKERTTNNNSKAILQLDMSGNIIKRWKSASEAAKALKCNSSAITMATLGLRKTAKGFQWKKN